MIGSDVSAGAFVPCWWAQAEIIQEVHSYHHRPHPPLLFLLVWLDRNALSATRTKPWKPLFSIGRNSLLFFYYKQWFLWNQYNANASIIVQNREIEPFIITGVWSEYDTKSELNAVFPCFSSLVSLEIRSITVRINACAPLLVNGFKKNDEIFINWWKSIENNKK